MARITKLFVPDSMQVEKELKLPLVVTKVAENGVYVYHGFVPGFTKEDCRATTQESCVKMLKGEVDKLIDYYLKNNMAFPFFPTKEEVIADFDNVCHITMIKI